MQNTFSQSGNDSKWFSKKTFFRIGMWNSRPPPPPSTFMEKTILNFHFDYLTTPLRFILYLTTSELWVGIELYGVWKNRRVLSCWPGFKFKYIDFGIKTSSSRIVRQVHIEYPLLHY